MASYTKKNQHTESILDVDKRDPYFVQKLETRIWESGRNQWKVVKGEKYSIHDKEGTGYVHDGWNVLLSKDSHALHGKYGFLSTAALQEISSVDIVIDSDFFMKEKPSFRG